MKIVGLEEHFVVPEVLHAWHSLDPRWQDLAVKPSSEGEAGRRLLEFGPLRIAAMDDTGIDVQVLSLTTAGAQGLTNDLAVELARSSNDQVSEVVRARPDRFSKACPASERFCWYTYRSTAGTWNARRQADRESCRCRTDQSRQRLDAGQAVDLGRQGASAKCLVHGIARCGSP